MPPFGRAHPILSGIHPDTELLGSGVDPTDGHVLTWVDSLKRWGAREAAGGVTDHGDLSGLDPDDDHSQYALADKSRPSPWVAAGDLAARSLADLGTKDHDLLAGLLDDDHTIYGLLSGRSGGQTFKGSTLASEHLTLQSTDHATRGYVRAQDDVQLLSNILRDAAGTARLTLAASSPHFRADGDVRIEGHASIESAPAAANYLNIAPNVGSLAAGRTVLQVTPSSVQASTALGFVAIGGLALVTPGAGVTLTNLAALAFSTAISGAGGSTLMDSIAVQNWLFTHTGTVVDLSGLHVKPLLVSAGTPTVTRAYGAWIENQGKAAVATVYGVRIVDQTGATTNLCLEVGPATPYLRVVGAWTAAAGMTPVYFSEGATPTLRNLRTKAFSALLAADLVCIAV